MREDRDGVIEIDLLKLLFIYLKKWWLIVLCGVLAAAVTLIYTATRITPTYRASVSIYVNNSSSGERADSISGGNLSASQQLVRTYINIITSDMVLEKVIQDTGLSMSTGYLRRIMSANQVNNTEIFQVYVTHPDPQLAADIANSIAKVAPDEIANIVEGSSTKIIDYAKVPTGRYAPSYRRNTIYGGLIGCVLAVIYVTLTYLLDDRLKNEEDLTSLFELPILGQIPDFAQISGRSSKHGYGYGYGRGNSASPEKGAGK